MLNQPRSEDRKNVIERGFTLVELLIVIVILGILAGIVVFAVGNLTTDAQSSACNTEKAMINTALESYKAKNGSYPSSSNADPATAATERMTTLNSVAGFKTAPVNYQITDNNGTVAVTSAGTTNGCS